MRLGAYTLTEKPVLAPSFPRPAPGTPAANYPARVGAFSGKTEAPRPQKKKKKMPTDITI